ncbi:hypothetical protein ACLOJK_009243 [Asimina triloba]
MIAHGMDVVDITSGLNSKIKNRLGELDEFYKRVIEEHLIDHMRPPKQGREDCVDILLRVEKESHLTRDHTKGMMMVSYIPLVIRTRILYKIEVKDIIKLNDSYRATCLSNTMAVTGAKPVARAYSLMGLAPILGLHYGLRPTHVAAIAIIADTSSVASADASLLGPRLGSPSTQPMR